MLCKNGLKIHFSWCFNRLFERFVQNYDFNQVLDSSDFDQVSNLLEYLSFYSTNNEELNEVYSYTQNCNLSIVDDNENYFIQLANFCDQNQLKNFHLNVNSIEFKLINLDSILSAKLYDIVIFSETKLDFAISSDFGKEYGYKVLRRDRNAHGDGLLVFINSKLRVTFRHNSPLF